MERCNVCESLVEKVEDLKLLRTYIVTLVASIRNGSKFPALVIGFNDAGLLDEFCALCEAVEAVRNPSGV